MGIFLRPCLAVALFVFMLNLSFSRASKVLPVGGNWTSLWKVPTSPDVYSNWAQSKRFHIGDTIVFKYDGKTDSVVRVSEEDFKSCDKSKAVESYSDGNTKVTLDKSGPFYFISGAHGHCESGQKVAVTVISPKVKPAPVVLAPAPAAEGPQRYGPAPAPKKSGAGKAARFVGGLAAAVCAVLAFA